jgi:hypothetical protein
VICRDPAITTREKAWSQFQAFFVAANNLVPRRKVRWSGIMAGRISATLKWLFCASVLALALCQFSENTADPDLWAHTLVGEHILLTGKLQNTELYSWTARGTPLDQSRVAGRNGSGRRAWAGRWNGYSSAQIEVVLEKKLHGPLASFTALSHIGKNGREPAAAKGNNWPMCGDGNGVERESPTKERGFPSPHSRAGWTQSCYIDRCGRQKAICEQKSNRINPPFAMFTPL